MAEQARPVTVLYFYKTRWGSHDEFVELFDRNHLPILEAQVESGRLGEVRRYVPHFHGEGRADWDVLVTITYRDWAALESGSDADIAERLFPDQATYRKEERRRFELLEAHWDVPLDERSDRDPRPPPARGDCGGGVGDAGAGWPGPPTGGSAGGSVG